MENVNQMMRLTGGELLSMWKTLLRLDEVRRECLLERSDGVDLDAWLMLHINKWYGELLAGARVEWLPVEDVSSSVVLTPLSSGIVRASVPSHCVRPVEWRLSGWEKSVTRFCAPDDAAAKRQLTPWLRSGSHRPQAVDYGDHLLLYGYSGTAPQLAVARCVVRPADGQFVFHQQAVSTFPALDQLML